MTGIDYVVDTDTLHRRAAETLSLNDVARVEIATAERLFFDSYRINTTTGSFVLVDPQSNATVAAGMIRGPVRDVAHLREAAKSSETVPSEDSNIARKERERGTAIAQP